MPVNKQKKYQLLIHNITPSYVTSYLLKFHVQNPNIHKIIKNTFSELITLKKLVLDLTNKQKALVT